MTVPNKTNTTPTLWAQDFEGVLIFECVWVATSPKRDEEVLNRACWNGWQVQRRLNTMHLLDILLKYTPGFFPASPKRFTSTICLLLLQCIQCLVQSKPVSLLTKVEATPRLALVLSNQACRKIAPWFYLRPGMFYPSSHESGQSQYFSIITSR